LLLRYRILYGEPVPTSPENGFNHARRGTIMAGASGAVRKSMVRAAQ
jgi:hypothetical protein